MRVELSERPKGLFVVKSVGSFGEDGWFYTKLVSLSGKEGFLKLHKWVREGKALAYKCKFYTEED